MILFLQCRASLHFCRIRGIFLICLVKLHRRIIKLNKMIKGLIKLRNVFFTIGLTLILYFSIGLPKAGAEIIEGDTTTDEIEHNWEISSTNYEIIHVDTHEYTYWKNFLRETRTCDVFHKIKTVVYYCDIHGHTKSESHLVEVIHSEKHA